MKKQSKIYAIKTMIGQEKQVLEMFERRVKAKGEPYTTAIKAAIWVKDVKGYIFVETEDPILVDELLQGIRHSRGRSSSFIDPSEIDKYLVVKPVIESLKTGDLVEIIGGPFKSMKGRVVAVDRQKSEVTLELLESASPFPITIYAEYLRKIEGGA
ncbi:transcription elongation factor Spt5 [Candidatus Bathyarchaeota archaeon]|nr:transcription elongation factor Spt5 [Candidatus Bathyarchaeota archaeon]MBS7612892.1 transcription elongation factor Spt5 [Candidatus Bathyarchaeota archaeon]MBS7618273.1 transcription elongation factor Spt5 [Candidatus Bathyarchaeota archaeon]